MIGFFLFLGFVNIISAWAKEFLLGQVFFLY